MKYIFKINTKTFIIISICQIKSKSTDILKNVTFGKLLLNFNKFFKKKS